MSDASEAAMSRSLISSEKGDEEMSAEWTLSSLENTKRLYGREDEKLALRQAYRRLWEAKEGSKPTIQIALVSGSAGSGKSALVKTLEQPVLEDGGYYVSGKFDQLDSSRMYGAFEDAFTALVHQALARGKETVHALKKYIENAVNTELQMLTNVVPALEKIIGKQDSAVAKEFRQSSDELNCFKFVFRMFVRAISSPEYPIVFVLEDLHFADEASLELFAALASDKANDGVLYVATYRREKNGEDSVREFLWGKNYDELEISDIVVGNLSPEATDEMMAEIFSVVDPSQLRPLTHIIYRHTHGNIFYMREFLRFLQEESLVVFDEHGLEWVWDERKIHARVDFRRSVDLCTVRLSKLPKSTQEVLQVAACLGMAIDEKLLNRISPRPVFSQLQRAASRGILIYNEASETYRFSHDIVQEAAYKLVSNQERGAFHLTIGRELWKSFDNIGELERHLFIILGQIREGADLITYQIEKNDIAALCLRAGEMAINRSSFQAASGFLLLGVSLLGGSCWEGEYELSLELYNAAAEVQYCIGSFENMEKLTSEIYRNTKWFPDTLRAHSIHVYALGSRGHLLKAIEHGLSVLDSLGEKLVVRRAANSLAVALKKTKNLASKQSSDRLLALGLMDNPNKIAAMQMMNVIFLYSYIAQPTIAPLIALRMVKLTIEGGLCAVSSVGFIAYAMLLCGEGKDPEEGFRMGDVALKLHEKFNNPSIVGRLNAWYYGAVYSWARPIRTIFEPLKRAHRIALETGDLDFAMLNANIYCWESLEIATLSKLERIVSGFTKRMEAYGNSDSVLMMTRPLWQMIHNLTDRGKGDPRVLTGKIMDQDYATQYAKENNKMLLLWIYFYRMFLAYIFNDQKAAESYSLTCETLIHNPFGSTDRVLITFIQGLVTLGDEKVSRAELNVAKKIVKSFKVWAKQCPENFLGKLNLLEAELASASGDPKRAHAKYTSAISLSKGGGFIVQHAIALERAGMFFVKQGDAGSAKAHLNEALAAYEKWGSKTKCKHMTKQIEKLFS